MPLYQELYSQEAPELEAAWRTLTPRLPGAGGPIAGNLAGLLRVEGFRKPEAPIGPIRRR